jgi:RNA polymerase sigma factor for flagellar operon FliA
MSVDQHDDQALERLWQRWVRHGSSAARDHLIVHYSPLVKYVVGRLGIGTHPTVDTGDLINHGIIGLIDALGRFEPERGVKFETFAVPRIRGAIYDGLRQLDWVPRSVRSHARQIEAALASFESRHGRAPGDGELARALDITVEQLAEWMSSVASATVGPLDRAIESGFEPLALDGDVPSTPARVVEDREVRAAMHAELRRLPEREKLVLGLYYDEGLTLAQIGEVLGVTESRVSQIRVKAVLHLRARLGAAGVA